MKAQGCSSGREAEAHERREELSVVIAGHLAGTEEREPAVFAVADREHTSVHVAQRVLADRLDAFFDAA